jgi:hypothetical protein
MGFACNVFYLRSQGDQQESDIKQQPTLPFPESNMVQLASSESYYPRFLSSRIADMACKRVVPPACTYRTFRLIPLTMLFLLGWEGGDGRRVDHHHHHPTHQPSDPSTSDSDFSFGRFLNVFRGIFASELQRFRILNLQIRPGSDTLMFLFRFGSNISPPLGPQLMTSTRSIPIPAFGFSKNVSTSASSTHSNNRTETQLCSVSSSPPHAISRSSPPRLVPALLLPLAAPQLHHPLILSSSPLFPFLSFSLALSTLAPLPPLQPLLSSCAVSPPQGSIHVAIKT